MDTHCNKKRPITDPNSWQVRSKKVGRSAGAAYLVSRECVTTPDSQKEVLHDVMIILLAAVWEEARGEDDYGIDVSIVTWTEQRGRGI